MSAVTAREFAAAQNTIKRARLQAAQRDGVALGLGLYPEDDEYWAQLAEEGIVTAYDLMKRDAIAAFSDFYKETHGFRPRHMDLNFLSLDQLAHMTAEL